MRSISSDLITPAPLATGSHGKRTLPKPTRDGQPRREKRSGILIEPMAGGTDVLHNFALGLTLRMCPPR